MTCPKCGNEVPEGKKFCGKCGTKLEDAPVVNNATNICAKCGAELTPGKKFCGKCGTPVAAAPSAEKEAEMVMSAGFVHWNILPGQLAAKVDEQDLAAYKDIKGFVVQEGIKALFFADGALVGELPGGKYPFKDMGVEEKKGLKKFFANIAAFFKGKQASALADAASIIIVLMRDAEFPMVFVEKDMPTAGIRSDVAVHIMAKITNIIQFYREQLLDKKFVSFEKLAEAIRPSIRTLLEDVVTGVDAASISSNAQMRESILDSLKLNISSIFPYISVERVIRLSGSNEELEELRKMEEELYISEKELEQLSKRNNFLNRLNDEKLQQQLREAQTQADFVAAMNKIDEQNQLTEDEKAKFADMLYWQRKLREATSKDEGETALVQLEKNGLLRAEELDVLKSDIEQRKKLKDLSDGQALAMLTLQNNMALDKQKLQWEIEIGNERIKNTLERQRMQDAYADERRKAEMAMDKEEQLTQLELLRQAQALRQEREDAEHKRKMEEEAAARSHEQTMTEMEQKHEEEMRRLFQNMSAEQIMAANPDISEAAANALAEKFKSQNAQAQVDMANKHSEDIQRIMQENAAQQNATMQQMMQMMGTMFANQQAKKDAEIADVRKDANAHQDRMENIIKTQATAAYGAAGKIYAKVPEKEKPASNNSRKDAFACPSCGAEIEEGSSFCGECGNSL